MSPPSAASPHVEPLLGDRLLVERGALDRELGDELGEETGTFYFFKVGPVYPRLVRIERPPPI
jgi:hypothetical protein